MKRIDIPGVGPVDFPDDMSDAEIGNVIERDILSAKQPPQAKTKKVDSKPRASDYLTARDPALLDQAVGSDEAMEPYTPSKKAPLSEEQRAKVEFATSEDLGRVYSPKGKLGTNIRDELSPMERQNLERLKAQNKDPSVEMIYDEQLRRPNQTKQPVELSAEETAYAAGLEANKDTRGQLTDREYLNAPEATAFEKGLASSGSSGVRAIDNFTAGELGSIGASLSYAGRKTGIDTLADVGDRMSGYAAGKTPSDQDFGDKLITGIGSAASFFVPGVGVMKGSRALSVLSPTLAKWTGAGTMAGLEAAAEADGVYREKIAQGATEQEAMAAADKAFTMNAAVLMVTDKVAFFNDIKVLDEATGKVSMSGLGKSAAVGSVSEGSQEAIQAVIGNYLTDKPLMEGVAEGAAIGAIIGGGLSPLSAAYQADARKVASDAVAAIPNAATVDDAIALAQQALTTPLETTSVSTTNSLAPLATGTPQLGSDLGSGGGTDILSGGGSGPVYAGGATLADPLGGGVELNNVVGANAPQLDTRVAPGQLQAKVDVGTGDIVSSSGAPYRTQKTAEMQLRAKGLEGQYEVKQVEGGFALAKTHQQPQAAAVPEYEDPIMPASLETVTGVESNDLTNEEPINAQENTLPDVGAQSRYAEQVATLNNEFASRADEIEARTGQRPPTIAAATSAEEQSFAPIADALKVTFGTEVVPFSDASATAPDGFAYKGTTWVNVSNLDRPAAFVAAHEFKHSMEQSKDPADRETAQWLEDNIMPLIEEVGQREYAEKFLFRGMSYEQVMADPELAQELRNEMTADFMAKRMTERSFLDSLAKRDPVGFGGFVQKWVKAIDGLIKSLRGKKSLGYSDVDKHITDLNKAKLIAQEALVRWRKNAMERQGESASAETTTDTDYIQFARKGRFSVLKREKASGRYIGAPDWVGASTEEVAKLYKKIRNFALEGESGKFWYEKSSKAVLDLVGGDKKEAEKFVGLLAIYSQGTEVGINTGFALEAYYQWKAGLPIKTGRFPGEQTKKAEKWLLQDKDWGGIKTNNFYVDLMEEINPASVDESHATMDMWMALAFDYGAKVLDQGPKYTFAKTMTELVAEDLGWKPHQVQAAVWSSIKTRIEATEKERVALERKNGIQTQNPDGTWSFTKGREYDHFRLAHKLGAKLKITPEEIAAKGFDFSDALRQRLVQMSWEATPSVTAGTIPGIHQASYEHKQEYLFEVAKALTENGKNAIAEAVGLHNPPTLFGVSAWEGQIGAGAQSFFPAPITGTKASRAVLPVARDLLNDYAALLGLVLKQDAVVWHTPIYDEAESRKNGVEIVFSRALTPEEMNLLYLRVNDIFNTWDIAPGYTASGVKLLNFVEGLDNKEFQKGVERVLDLLPDDFAGGGTPERRAFRSDGEYISNNWTEDREGEKYQERLRARRPGILTRAAELRARVETVDRKFNEKYGWGETSDTVRYSRKQLDGARGQGSTEPAAGPREGAVRVYGVHYSNVQRQTLDGRFYGTGIKGAEQDRVLNAEDERLKSRLYFYVDEGKGVRAEGGVGGFVHNVTLDNLYDTSSRTLSWEKDPNGDVAVTTNNFETAVLDAGYSGYYRPAAFGNQGVAVLLGDAAVDVVPNDAPQFSRKALQPTSQSVLMLERSKAKDSWGRHLDKGHLAAVEGEDAAVGDLLNGLYLLAAQRKDAFDKYIKELAKATGTQAKTAPLKKRERSLEKIMVDYNGDVADMKDVLRATIATESMAQAQQIYDALSADGQVADVKGALKSSLETGTGAGYRDAKVILDVDGVPAELIIAPQSLLRAKELAHSMYERQRSLDAKLRKATASKERALFRSQIEALDAKMIEVYLPAAQRAQSSSAVLREQGSALSRTVSMLNGLLSGSNAKNPESISATGLPSKSKNLVPSGNSSNGVDIVNTSNDIIPEGNNLRYSRKIDPKVKDWAVSIKNRKAAKPIMMIVDEPSKALKAAGVYRQVTMDEPHVRHVYNKHAEITPDDIASLPFALQNPRAGIARPDGSTRLIVDGRDAQGNPLAVALNNLNVGEGKGKIKVTEVSTLFGNKDSASLIVNSLLDGSVKYLRENEIDRLTGLMLVTKQPANVEGAYGMGIASPLPENQSLPTSGPITNQPQVVSVQTENGVVNLRVNDNAKQLARGVQFSRKQTETPEFKAWFGDSKVVDENGEPLVVYHGTSYIEEDGNTFSEFEAGWSPGIHFTSEPSVAEAFNAGRPDNHIIPVYLSMRNPKTLTGKAAQNFVLKGVDNQETVVSKAADQGHDGLIVRDVTDMVDVKSTHYVVFSPSQIKSAIGNNGQFDPENDDIRFARKGSPTGSQFALPDETTGEGYIRQWQNDQVRWKRQMDLLREKGVVNDQNDVYQAMERMVARAMNRTEDFYKNNVTPVLQRMSELAVTMDEVGDYLYALHAKERNAAIRDINPRFANAGYNDVGGSGMSDAEADQIVQDTKAKTNFKDIEAIAREFRSWADANLNGLVQGGLLTPQQAADMQAKYPNYVPLQGFEDMEGETMLGQGAGYSNAKNVVKRALGRGSRAGNPAVYIIHGVAEGMLAREKANVGRYLERLIQDNPDDKLWTIGQPEREPVMGKSPLRYEVMFNGTSAGTFMSKRQAQQYIKLMNLKGATIDETGGDPTVIERDLGYDPDSEVRFLRDGKQVRIQLKDPLLARAYNNRGMEEIGTILRASASINSFLREMWTQKNPVFPFVNVIRDIPAGALYATGEHGAALAGRVIRNTPAAWYAMWQQASGKPITNGMDQWVKEYRLAGGGIGFRMVGDIQSTMDKINRIEKQLGNKTVLQALAGGEIKEAGKRLLWKTYNNAVTDFIERVNIAFENMTRLAIFKAAREQNLSMAEAARLAKNATVNFNRKGEKTPNLNALYLFANASVQDLAKNKRTVMDAANRNQARAILAAVASLGFITAMLSDDDEDLEEENRNINNVRFKVGDSRVSIPLSYGLIGFSHYLGRSVAKALQGEDLSLQSIRLASALITNSAPVNPLPNPDRVDGTNAIIGMMPTPLEFPAEVFLNRNSFGSDMRPDYNDNPDAYKAFRGTRGSVYADIAAYLNENTGGTTRESGFIDVSPETMKGFMHFTLGGTGKFVADSASTTRDLLDGGGVNSNNVPLLNRFVKKEDVTTYRARFYRQAGEAKDKLELYNKYLKDGNSEKRKELAPWVILGRRGNMMWKQMNAIRDRELSISRDDTLTAEERDAQLKALADKQIAISDKYHRLYKKKTSGV